MKTITLLTAAMLVTPLAAQAPDRGGESRIQLHGEFMRPRQVVIGQVNLNDVKDQAENQIGFGIRLIGELPGTNDWYYELGGKLESSSKFASKPSAPNGQTDTTGVKFKYSYVTLGMGYLWGLAPGLSLGAHLEARVEALNLSGTMYTNSAAQQVDASVTYVRPWARVSLDYAFRAGGTSPFIGVDASLAMLKSSQDSIVALAAADDNTVKSMAPQASFSVYVGLKF